MNGLCVGEIIEEVLDVFYLGFVLVVDWLVIVVDNYYFISIVC